MHTKTILSLAVLTAGFVLGGQAQAQAPETATLKYKPVKVWDYFQPAETWNSVGGVVPIPQGGESGFLADNKAFKLGLDTDGNGKPDHEVKGVAGYALLKGKDADGEAFKYAVRIRKGTEWEYASSGVYTGKVMGETISLIDQNGNGVWNEIGEDAMIVGKGDSASYLSAVVNLKGALYTLDVAPDGRSVSVEPYVGESGVLDATGAFETKGKLLSAVFSSKDGQLSFDLSDVKGGLLVPTGEYLLDSGFAVKKKDWVRIRRGQMRAIEVESGVPTQVAWGGPLEMRFGESRNSDTEVTVEPPTFWGHAGEEYYDFFPSGRSPEIIVVNGDGKEVWSGKFCES